MDDSSDFDGVLPAGFREEEFTLYDEVGVGFGMGFLLNETFEGSPRLAKEGDFSAQGGPILGRTWGGVDNRSALRYAPAEQS